LKVAGIRGHPTEEDAMRMLLLALLCGCLDTDTDSDPDTSQDDTGTGPGLVEDIVAGGAATCTRPDATGWDATWSVDAYGGMDCRYQQASGGFVLELTNAADPNQGYFRIGLPIFTGAGTYTSEWGGAALSLGSASSAGDPNPGMTTDCADQPGLCTFEVGENDLIGGTNGLMEITVTCSTLRESGWCDVGCALEPSTWTFVASCQRQ
jgi:hypothetical protein